MYVIVVYDVTEDKVNKVCNYLRRYLTWIQNSVFEGELSLSTYIEMKDGLERLIDIERDSIKIYILSSDKELKKESIGKRYKETSQFI